jgi:glycosyltransferase involved in cell wall biosynthesis
MWQAEQWTRALVNVLSDDELRGRKPKPGDLATAWRLFRRRKAGNVVSSAGGGVAFYYALLARLLLCRKPPHVVREFFLPEPQAGSKKWRLKRYLRRIVFSQTAAIIVYSEGERQLCAEYLGLPESRFHTVLFHTNILTPCFEPGGSYGFAAGRSERDYRTFFEAIRGLAYPFVVVSDKASVAGLDIPENVELHCNIPREDYLSLLRKAAFVVVPLHRRQRSTGQVVILEGNALGKPVVATRVVGTVDYVRPGETGLLCEPYDVPDMRAAIGRLVGNPQERERLGRNALEMVERNHTFQVHVDRMLAVIQSAAGLSDA